MAQIDDFKANLLGGGARTNQFRVTITPPPGIAIGLDVRRTSFLTKASKTPEVSLGEIELAYRGRKIYMTGDREAADAWPKTMSEVTLDSSEDSTIAEFECTWRYQHFEASGVNF